MLKPQDIAIVNGARTPMGEYCGKLRDFTAQELGAIAGIEAMKRSGVEPREIEHVVYGNAQQTSVCAYDLVPYRCSILDNRDLLLFNQDLQHVQNFINQFLR